MAMRSEERFSRNAETEIYTLSLHDALPISQTSTSISYSDLRFNVGYRWKNGVLNFGKDNLSYGYEIGRAVQQECRDRDLHSFPTRRSSDLTNIHKHQLQ